MLPMPVKLMFTAEDELAPVVADDGAAAGTNSFATSTSNGFKSKSAQSTWVEFIRFLNTCRFTQTRKRKNANG